MDQSRPSILIVDDERSVRDSLRAWFEKEGYHAECAADGVDALSRLGEDSYDIVLIDIRMPKIGGMDFLHRVREIDADVVCIMITAYASVDTAVESLKAGAFDYVSKPVDPDELTRIVHRAIEKRRLSKENLALRTQLQSLAPEDDLLGESEQVKRLRDMISSVARSDASVLIRGESGTGKELVARLVHGQSARRFCPLVPVHCGALPESLLESELFGHEKGAFTGAHHRHRGKLEVANGGTLFLDEVGTIDPRTQVDLLRVLEGKQFTRIGGNRVISVDFRVIAATNEDLEKLVESGRFREDFYYRINVFPIDVPPLRERPGDVIVCAKHFLEKFTRQMNRNIAGFTDEASSLLRQHAWPGNVRELKNAVERAVVVCDGNQIRPQDLPLDVARRPNGPADDSLGALEKTHIARILSRENGNVTRTAKILGIDRVTLYNRMKKYGLSR